MGGGALPFVDVAEVHAAIEPLSGREQLLANQLEAVMTHRIRTRFYPGVKPSWRVKFIDAELAKVAPDNDPTPGLRLFDIESIADPESRHRELELMCTELVDW
jgi:head-tail adaptor